MTNQSNFTTSGDPVRWVRLVPTIGVAILVIIVASFAFDVQHIRELKQRAMAESAGSALGLRLSSKSRQVEISWDHQATAIHEAEKGTMRIWDGDDMQLVPFDARQLQDGSLTYRPRSSDVSVRMEVSERDGRQVAESARTAALR